MLWMWHLVHVGLALQLRARFATNTNVATHYPLPQQQKTRTLGPKPPCRQNISTPHSATRKNGDVAFCAAKLEAGEGALQVTQVETCAEQNMGLRILSKPPV